MLWTLICLVIGYVVGHYWHEDVKYILGKVKKTITSKK